MTNELLARIDLLTEQLEDYKQRCEKAINYIEKNYYNTAMDAFEVISNMGEDVVEIDDLLNILKGGDEE